MTAETTGERLEPTPNTEGKLYSASGGYCAYPTCDQYLFVNDTYIGDICHIEAVKPSGTRYNLNQTNEERRGYENLIIFCKNHHTLVDKDENYAVENFTCLSLQFFFLQGK